MPDSHNVNLSSLKLVHDELITAIEQAGSQLEQFVSDREDGSLLQGCVDGIKQINGILNLVQLRGASELAAEMLAAAGDLTVGVDQSADALLSSMGGAFFILPRYVEYTQQTGRAIPVLLLPYLNELRQLRQQPALPESHFFTVSTQGQRPRVASGSTLYREDLAALVRRLRHMYQVGLVNVLRGKMAKQSLGMMQRAVQRLDKITGNQPLGNLWWLADIALGLMAARNMELTHARKLLLGSLDRQVKRVMSEGQDAFEQPAPDSLLRELLYLIAISGEQDDPAVAQVRESFQLPEVPYTDAELKSERESLKGPSANTVSSVAAVLKDELRSTKEILERASQGGVGEITDFGELLETLNKVADILSVVGLVSPANTLKQQIQTMEQWQAEGHSADGDDMLEVADTLLYIESTVSGLDTMNLSDDKLAKANSIARQEVIAKSQLAEAELVVLREAESGLAMVKRALSSYAESNYDRAHIKNVAASLTAVRGGMSMLGLSRAASVVGQCVNFIEQRLLQGDQPEAVQPLLETFADAIIGLEYYLEAISADKRADDKALDVAEESLSALGFAV